MTEAEKDAAFALIKDELSEIRKEFHHLEIDSAILKTDVGWLKRFFWIVTGSSIGAFLGVIAQILSRK
jgi:hypothetical protein